jgi:hypothetical protein
MISAPWSRSEYLKPIKNRPMMSRQITSTVTRVPPEYLAAGLSSMAIASIDNPPSTSEVPSVAFEGGSVSLTSQTRDCRSNLHRSGRSKGRNHSVICGALARALPSLAGQKKPTHPAEHGQQMAGAVQRVKPCIAPAIAASSGSRVG